MTVNEANESRIKQMFVSRLQLRPPVDDDPRQFSRGKKALILSSIALCAGTSGFASTIYFPGLPAITSDLNAPPMATTLTAALFVLFMGIAPVFWATLSDFYQVRRILFMFSMMIFGAASLGSTFLNNIWGIVVLRCVQSFGSSCGQSVGAGVIADCYPVEQRGAAFGKYFFGVFLGPLLGPIVGGFLIISNSSWRATFLFCVALAVFNIAFVFFALPETYRIDEKFDTQLPFADRLSLAEGKSKGSASDSLSETLSGTDERPKENASTANVNVPSKPKLNPISVFLLLRHPFILMGSLVSGIAFGCMFATETIVPILYTQYYGFSSWETGLSYLGAGLGNLFGSLVGGFLSDRLLLRSRRLRGGAAVVEDRITANLWPCGCIIVPFGLLLFGWSIQSGKTVWAPIIAFGIQCFGVNQVMTGTSAYLVDAMPGRGASATAAANFVRMVLACALSLISNPLVESIGPGWTSVLLASMALFSMLLLLCLKIWGERLRRWSGFA
ncbi:hypothetical protein EC973_002252 [Apophysomyces ossiformis]|uniref:Major facilitator superfamily (MFS) profile domain-containing protein n=1 Tax=Apophysomyces ossiformis TaxID=679940 RepID=A0A8H7BUC9_9FUNG|nr:hypothetical protein EC973_002252 [Apophysomyces ossiformis]